jgi:hypothetical protein
MPYAFVSPTAEPVYQDSLWTAFQRGVGQFLAIQRSPHRRYYIGRALRLFAVETARRFCPAERSTFQLARLAAAGGVLEEDLRDCYLNLLRRQHSPQDILVCNTVNPSAYYAARLVSDAAFDLRPYGGVERTLQCALLEQLITEDILRH